MHSPVSSRWARASSNCSCWYGPARTARSSAAGVSTAGAAPAAALTGCPADRLAGCTEVQPASAAARTATATRTGRGRDADRTLPTPPVVGADLVVPVVTARHAPLGEV